MTPEAQRIAIAVECGWKRLTYKEAQAFDNTIIEFAGWDDPKTSLVWLSPDLKVFSYDTFRLPDYLNDLNAMREAEKVLSVEQKYKYVCILREMVTGVTMPEYGCTFATAEQRAEAFCHIRPTSRGVPPHHRQMGRRCGMSAHEKPKAFRGHEVRAILNGDKTQWRDIAKGLESGEHPSEAGGLYPLYPVGTRVWVRETWAARIWLEITDVRVQRLQDISEEDAMAEGVDWRDYAGLASKTARKLFADLWESINGKDSWHANPWVWVYEFQRLEGGAA